MTDNLPAISTEAGVATYRLSTDAAELSRAIVLQTALEIQGRKYVRVEGWQAIAVAHGCTASSGNVERTPDGFKATGQVRRMDTGAVIAEAEGFVGVDEPVWFGGEATDRWGKKKTHVKRPDYAIRAMAQTRAISRACRSAFAHVVVMIDKDLGTTPAEEMMGVVLDQPSQPAAKEYAADPDVSDAAARWVSEQSGVLATLANLEDAKAWHTRNKKALAKLEASHPTLYATMNAAYEETVLRMP